MTVDAMLPPRNLIGVSSFIRSMYGGQDVAPICNALVERVQSDRTDFAATLEIGIILQSIGQAESGLQMQASAVQMQRIYTKVMGDGSGLRLLVFVTVGDMTSNTPVEFLMEGSNAILHYLYIDESLTHLPAVPDHDIAFMAIGEGPERRGTLENMQRLLSKWTRTAVVNSDCRLILRMTRDGVHRDLATARHVLSPPVRQCPRQIMLEAAKSESAIGQFLLGLAYPIIVRPAGTHAGGGMKKLDDAACLRIYLEEMTDQLFYVTQFIDYRSADGLFRKMRVMFLDGQSFPVHMAASSDWMVHYINAGMDQSLQKRSEEQQWMMNFDEDFARRHALAFKELVDRFPLDYFGIDCAELADGRLLVFEADNIMIVHDMDPIELYPYKKPVMNRVFASFQQSLSCRSGRTGTKQANR